MKAYQSFCVHSILTWLLATQRILVCIVPLLCNGVIRWHPSMAASQIFIGVKSWLITHKLRYILRQIKHQYKEERWKINPSKLFDDSLNILHAIANFHLDILVTNYRSEQTMCCCLCPDTSSFSPDFRETFYICFGGNIEYSFLLLFSHNITSMLDVFYVL